MGGGEGIDFFFFLVGGVQITGVNKCSYPDMASNGQTKLGVSGGFSH